MFRWTNTVLLRKQDVIQKQKYVNVTWLPCVWLLVCVAYANSITVDTKSTVGTKSTAIE